MGKKMKMVFDGVEFSLTPEMIEEALTEVEHENPRADLSQERDKVVDRIMEKITASAKSTPK